MLLVIRGELLNITTEFGFAKGFPERPGGAAPGIMEAAGNPGATTLPTRLGLASGLNELATALLAPLGMAALFEMPELAIPLLTVLDTLGPGTMEESIEFATMLLAPLGMLRAEILPEFATALLIILDMPEAPTLFAMLETTGMPEL